jgi:peroxiredoxin
MTIKVGDKLPRATFMTMGPDGPKPRTTDEIFDGRKVVMFGLPGAFTPTCHRNHLPGYAANAEAFKARGVDEIAVISVNDVFVMDAWEKGTGSTGKVSFLADGSADFARATGLVLDLTAKGMGVRSQRYSMLVEDGVVTKLNLEDAPAGAELSSGAEALLRQM